jgi:hypothetical protein
LKVGAKVPAQGEPVEYLLGMSGDIRADALIVIRKGEVKPGATEFGSITLVVPNGRKMAERVAAGSPPARIVDGTNFVKDPDGYTMNSISGRPLGNNIGWPFDRRAPPLVRHVLTDRDLGGRRCSRMVRAIENPILA